jgi:hemoglobin
VLVTSAVAPTPYDRLGGEPAVRKLVDRFYDLMSELPEAAHVLRMHPADLSSSRDKFFDFLSGWLGGPPLYAERRGHPRLRMRHMHFPIDNAARDAWLTCMYRALDECVEDTLLKEMLRGSFSRMGDHLRNVGEQERPEDT